MEIDDIFAAANSKKRKQPEPQEKQPSPRKRVKRSKKVKLDDKKFADSRGSSSRRKTEEGYVVYKEEELGINDTGGDTPLCPFDCNCCF